MCIGTVLYLQPFQMFRIQCSRRTNWRKTNAAFQVSYGERSERRRKKSGKVEAQKETANRVQKPHILRGKTAQPLQSLPPFAYGLKLIIVPICKTSTRARLLFKISKCRSSFLLASAKWYWWKWYWRALSGTQWYYMLSCTRSLNTLSILSLVLSTF